MSSKDGNFASLVADHYNNVEQKPRKEREKSDIIALRKFNNAMKSYLHSQGIKYCIHKKTNLRVLDLGCGKGGDLPKYLRNLEISFVAGVDIADISIEQCKERFKHLRQYPDRNLKAEFFVADLTKEDITPTLQKMAGSEKFDLVSSQFNIHYSFESFEQAIRYITNASKNLKIHGLIIGTYPDGPKLLKLSRESTPPGAYIVDDILKIEFSPEALKNPKPFGTKYHFRLKEVVDCPEFLVHPQVLKVLMEQLGFIQVFDRSFEEHILECYQTRSNDWKKFKEVFRSHDALCLEDEGVARIDEITWRAASIYRCFCWRKVKEIN